MRNLTAQEIGQSIERVQRIAFARKLVVWEDLYGLPLTPFPRDPRRNRIDQIVDTAFRSPLLKR